jgi:hypothetical protein
LEQQQQQESYSSNVDYIDGLMKQLRKSTTNRASRIKKMLRMATRPASRAKIPLPLQLEGVMKRNAMVDQQLDHR